MIQSLRSFRVSHSSEVGFSSRRIFRVPSIAAFLLLASMFACGGGSSNTTTPAPPPTLRQVVAAHNIKVGAAADSPYLSDSNYATILGSEFSQLQAENEMKFSFIHPGANTYDFSGGDALVSFAQTHTMVVRGHTLVWHNQVPSWVTSGSYASSQLSTICKTTSRLSWATTRQSLCLGRRQ